MIPRLAGGFRMETERVGRVIKISGDGIERGWLRLNTDCSTRP